MSDEFYPMYHCQGCGFYFKDRRGTVKEGLGGQQSTVESITCEACRIEAELPEIPSTGTVAIMVSRRGKDGQEDVA